MTKKEKILQWLKDNNVYEEFYNNFKNSSSENIPPTDKFIIQAFFFERTPEGFDYWWDINEQYKEWYYEEFPNDCINLDDFSIFESKYKKYEDIYHSINLRDRG